jgi:hypothetical protein
MSSSLARKPINLTHLDSDAALQILAWFAIQRHQDPEQLYNGAIFAAWNAKRYATELSRVTRRNSQGTNGTTFGRF